MITGILAKMIAMKVIRFEDGIISIKDRTVVFMPVDVIMHLHGEMSKKCGKKKANEIIFETGRYQTRTGAPRYFEEKGRLRTLFKRGNPSIEMGRDILKFVGMGDIVIREVAKDGSHIVLASRNSPIATEQLKTKGKSKEPVCHYVRGVMTGVLEVFYKKRYKAMEKSCKATGLSKECIFEFKALD